MSLTVDRERDTDTNITTKTLNLRSHLSVEINRVVNCKNTSCIVMI